MISAGSGLNPGAGGMISYYEGLVQALCEREDIAAIVAFVTPWNEDRAIPEDAKIERVVCRGLPRGRVGRVAYEQLILPALARRHGIDALISTVNIVPLLRRGATVLVLQSFQPFIWPTRVNRLRRAYLRFFTPRSLARADAVISVTEAARLDAMRLFDVDPDKMVTVHHGVSNWTKSVVRRNDGHGHHRLPDGSPYVLVVSRLYDFKNHSRLIEAFARVVGDPDVPHHLVIAGGDADVSRADLEAQAAACGVAHRVHCLGRVPQDEIPGLFLGAAAVAYVSLYETFGHPVLEAFAFGLPVLTSSSGATAEVSGDAARLVDPESVEDIAAGLRDVLMDRELRARLAEAGPRRLAEFTWDRCAEGTTQAVLLALNRRNKGSN